MLTKTHQSFLTCLLGLSLLPAATAGDPWTDLGGALPGSIGDPQLAATGSLQVGDLMTLDLSSALPGATAGLFFGLSPVALPFKGGTLQVSPLIPPLIVNTSPAGSVPLGFPWPVALPSGTEITFQYGILDPGAPVGVALSNAVLGTMPLPIPEATGTSITTISEGSSIQVLGSGFVEDAIDYCAQVLDGNGVPVAALKASAADGDSLTLEVGAIVPGATSGQIALIPGDGIVGDLSGVQDMVPLGDSWVWDGLPGDMVMVPGTLTLVPPPPVFTCNSYFPTMVGQNIEFSFPLDSGLCPVGTQFYFDLHIVIDGIPYYTDAYFPLSNTTPLSSLLCAFRICDAYEKLLEDKYGASAPDILCFPQQIGSEVKIVILPPGNQQFTSFFGYMDICADDVCDDYTGSVAANSIELEFPCTPGAQVTVDVVGVVDGGGTCVVSVPYTVPGGATPASCANDLIADIDAAFLALCGMTTTSFNITTGANTRISITPPFLESWDTDDSSANVEVCP
jgi:hypothetical protein